MPVKRGPRPTDIAVSTAIEPALHGTQGAGQELDRLKRQLRHNERIWDGFRRIEIQMIGAQTLRELVGVLTTEFPRTFTRVDCVTLACFDPEYELTRMLEAGTAESERGAGIDIAGHFATLSYDALARLFPAPHKPVLGPCRDDVRSLLFAGHRGPLASVALAPLVLRNQLIGSLNQGSRDISHFSPETATDLLEHLAAVAAMCVDNVVNRERLRLYGLMDPLTGVANRRFFERRLGEEVERWFRRGEPLTAMLVDVDHFKSVNDRFGHQIGDRVLQEVAGLLGRDLRAADVLARYGGEEFVLLLPNASPAQATAIAQRVCAHVARHRFHDGDPPLSVTVSVGVACLNADSELDGDAPAAWLLQQADAALYRAKQTGRNRAVVAQSNAANATPPPLGDTR